MGEKLMAQRLLALLRETVGKNSREAEAVLGWARDNRDWLWPDRESAESDGAGDEIGWDSLATLAGKIDVAEPVLPVWRSLPTCSSLSSSIGIC